MGPSAMQVRSSSRQARLQARRGVGQQLARGIQRLLDLEVALAIQVDGLHVRGAVRVGRRQQQQVRWEEGVARHLHHVPHLRQPGEWLCCQVSHISVILPETDAVCTPCPWCLCRSCHLSCCLTCTCMRVHFTLTASRHPVPHQAHSSGPTRAWTSRQRRFCHAPAAGSSTRQARALTSRSAW